MTRKKDLLIEGRIAFRVRQGDDRNVNAEKIKFTKLYMNTHRKEIIHVK